MRSKFSDCTEHTCIHKHSSILRLDLWFGIDSVDIYMWQSRVEIEGYSVAYFDRIVAFEAPYR